MGGAMVKGWTQNSKDGGAPFINPENLLIADPSPGPAALFVIEHGASHFKRLEHVVSSAKYVLLAIKPQSFSAIGPEVAMCLPKGCVVISIMAGPTMKSLEAVFPDQHCVRAMPNTPAAIGKGITGYVCGSGLSPEQKQHVADLLAAGGETVELAQENMIDMVTALSGSGPAYFFYMVEALAAAGVSAGLSQDQAEQLAQQTLIGAGALLEQSGQTAAELRHGVTSPNGTTQAALDVLMSEQGLAHIIRDAVTAAYHRSQELGKS